MYLISLLCVLFHISFYISRVHATCGLQMTYDDCYNKNLIKVIWCENKNSGPLVDYYACMCENKRLVYNCYSICSDDAQKQLESQSFLLDVTNTCQMAENQKALTTTTTTTTSTTTAVRTTTKPRDDIPSSTTTTTTVSTKPSSRPNITVFGSHASRTINSNGIGTGQLTLVVYITLCFFLYMLLT